MGVWDDEDEIEGWVVVVVVVVLEGGEVEIGEGEEGVTNGSPVGLFIVSGEANELGGVDTAVLEPLESPELEEGPDSSSSSSSSVSSAALA
jgi:hypothetical protein